MAYDTNLTTNYQTLEYQKFVSIINDTNFPPVSVVRTDITGLTSLDIYPKTAVLTYNVNGGGGGGGGGDASASNQLLQLDQETQINAKLAALTGVNAATYTMTVSVVSGSGSTGVGKTLSFANIGSTSVTIGSSVIPAGVSFSVDAPGSSTISSVSYNATGGALLITKLS